MANEVLRVAMAEKGETVESLAEKVRVDPKTAARWLAAGRRWCYAGWSVTGW
ncbi:hypothetical protein ABZ570_14635 [Micromonospora sp. NPDC007271]|uniref:hypothetical protein n=1 Tax=Micromonospora sp. NPDC007271 TaxID=3154587 RepID=UPI0033E6D1DC